MSRRLALQTGMTLIELLGAISVLSIMSLLGYRAFSALLVSQAHLQSVSSQWLELARVFRRVERDLESLPSMELPVAGHQQLQLEAAVAGGLLHLPIWRAGMFSGYVQYQAGPDGLTWSSSQSGTASYPLLPAGYQVRWRLLLADGRWVAHWPERSGGGLRALEMQIAHPAIGEVRRLWSF